MIIHSLEGGYHSHHLLPILLDELYLVFKNLAFHSSVDAVENVKVK